MLRRPVTVALCAGLALGAAHAADTPPADLAAMQQRLDQLGSLVGKLRSELDGERSARRKVESTGVIRPVTDGKSLKMQSPRGDFSFRVGAEARTAGARWNAAADSPTPEAPRGGVLSTQESMV